jgi:hypothetical protein
MRADTLRLILIALLVVAGGVNVIANKTHSTVVGWLSFVVLAASVVAFVQWRRTALRERNAATVAAGGTERDEARARADQ